MRRVFPLLLAILISSSAFASEEGLRFEVTVAAGLDDVWNTWTTVEGIKTFFAGDAKVELRAGGAYEIFFDPSAPAGKRGADDMEVLLVQKPVALAFTWNAPPKFPEARKNRTHVMIRLSKISDDETRVVLTHDGFGEGAEWDAVREYFGHAWGEYVLPRLVQRFATPVTSP